MKENAKFTKEWYRKEIVDHKKSIPQIAAEQNVTVAAVRKEIRSLYARPAWANKLIGQAAANEAEKRNLVNAPVARKQQKKTSVKKTGDGNLPYEMRLALKRGVAIVDSNYAINYYDDCKKIEHLLIPRFCLNEMKRVAEFAPTVKERQAIERKVRYFEKKAEILFVENLPALATCETNRDFKARSFNFARYVQYVWQIHGFKVPYLTRAYEANVLIKECVKLEITQE